MLPPIYRTTIKLIPDKVSSNDVEEYFEDLRTYFDLASENGLTYSRDELKINVGNRFTDPPMHGFSGPIPPETRMFPFDLSITIVARQSLSIEYEISYFWTVIVYVLALIASLAISLLATNGDIGKASKFIIWFYTIFITLCFGGMAILKTRLFKQKIIEIWKRRAFPKNTTSSKK